MNQDDLTLRKLAVLALSASLAACATPPPPEANLASPPTQAVATCDYSKASHRPNFDEARKQRLEEIVRKLVDLGVAPGAVLRIEQAGRTVVDYSYGLADRENGTPMRSDALFRLYSMTKPITSVAAMRLVENGTLDLDDPVARYIPAFADARVQDADGLLMPLERPISIRDLLTHTAGISYRTDTSPVGKLYAQRGIPAGPGVANPPTDGSLPVASLAELAERVATTPLEAQPGTEWGYGNATDVLGRVLEVATGKPLQQVLSEQVLSPTGMNDTAFQVAPAAEGRMTAAYFNPSPKKAGSGVLAGIGIETIESPNLFLADPAIGGIFASAPPIAYGGAGLVGTAEDYLRFTSMLRAGGTAQGQRTVEQSTIDQMRSNQILPDARSDDATLAGLGFGLGFATRLAPTDRAPRFPQCGYFWGGAASTFFWIDPAGDVSGVLMTQVFGGDASSFWLAIIRDIYSEAEMGD